MMRGNKYFLCQQRTLPSQLSKLLTSFAKAKSLLATHTLCVAFKGSTAQVSVYLRSTQPLLDANNPFIFCCFKNKSNIKYDAKDTHPIKTENIPGCTYCRPQIASVGLTEKQAKDKGHKIKVGRFPYMANGKK